MIYLDDLDDLPDEDQADEGGCDCIPGLGCPHVDDEVPWPDDVFRPRPVVTVHLPAEDVT